MTDYDHLRTAQARVLEAQRRAAREFMTVLGEEVPGAVLCVVGWEGASFGADGHFGLDFHVSARPEQGIGGYRATVKGAGGNARPRFSKAEAPTIREAVVAAVRKASAWYPDAEDALRRLGVG